MNTTITAPAVTNVAAVAGRMKISVLTTGMWRATRLHKSETRDTNARHHIANAAKVLVRVTDHPALSDLSKLHAAAYAEHKRLTLPTIQDGMRLMPVGREFEHAKVMREYSDRHHALVSAFLGDYEQEAAEAPVRLNGLYDPSMWPPLSVVAARFTFSTRYLATPTGGAWGDWLAESARAADAEVRDRLTEALTRVKDRCASDGKLYASVFDSIRELVDLVPDFDTSGVLAPVTAAMAPLAALHADVVRDDKTARQAAADKATSILSVLGGIK
jgi:hypothetical protein